VGLNNCEIIIILDWETAYFYC